MPQLPAFLSHSPSFPFVGRSRELDLLRALVPRAPDEGRHVALIGGEPGSGKSRLVRELAAELDDEGIAVLYGGCDSAVRTPYGPFVEALEQPVGRAAASQVRGGPAAARDLARLLPGHGAAAGEPPSAARDPDAERHRLHVAVTDLLADTSKRSPLLLVVEDVHWADQPTLLLLRHLVRSGRDARMLVLVTYRDIETDMTSELSDTLVDLRRSDDVARVRLKGLSVDEIREFARRTAGVDPTSQLVAALAELTGGNAFLLTELWRELADAGSLDGGAGLLRLTRPAGSLATPEAVRAVVAQRLERLAPGTVTALEVAAVAGAEFELTTLRSGAGLVEGDLLDAIDEAERSGLVGDVPGRGLTYRFSHELVRRSVIERLSASRRAEIHLQVAEALVRDDPTFGRRGRLAALAHHFAEAAPLGGTDRAVAYSLLAARAAVDSLAFDEAVKGLRTALELGIPDPDQEAEAWLELGDAHHRAGDSVEAMEAFARAAELARALGEPELLARAAIGFEEACWRPGIHDAGSLELLQEAAAALDDDDSELRTRLLGGLARALEFQGRSIRAALTRDESIAMARRRGDRRGLAQTLSGAYWSRGVSTAEEIHVMLDESLQIGEELGDSDLCTEALSWLVPSYVSLCDQEAARRTLARLLEAARRQSQPFHLHVAEHYASALALCDGDLADAESAALRSDEWSRLLTGRDASGVHGIQMFSIRREQGRLAEIAPVVRVLADKGGGAWRPGLVAVLAELGMTPEARLGLRQVIDEELDEHRRTLWLLTLTYLTDASAAVGDAGAAERLYPELAPHRGSNVVIGHLVACYGAADRYMGMLAAVLGEWERSEEHFETALELNRRLGARTWLAHTAFAYGRMMLARGRKSDEASVEALLGESLGLARSIGLNDLVGRIRALRTPAEPSGASLDGLTGREAEILGLVARGLSNRDIGRSLFISEHTAANHVRNILRKTGCANRTEAAAYAHRRGLVGA